MKVSIGFLVTAAEMHNRNIAIGVSERKRSYKKRRGCFCLVGLIGSIKLLSLEEHGCQYVLNVSTECMRKETVAAHKHCEKILNIGKQYPR